MKKNLSPRDLAELSAYLDGELSASASAKMKSRLARDPNLAAALDDLRETKNILRRIPKRRAPRNFTLTPQMVAARPPMPRLVPVLNYASVLAIFLFFISFISPVGFDATAPSAPEMMPAPELMMEAAESTIMEEAPAAEEAPAEKMPVAEEAASMADTVIAEPTAEETVESYAGTAVEGDENAVDAIEPTTTARAADDAEKSITEQEADGIAIAPTLPVDGTLVAEFTATPSTKDTEEMPRLFEAPFLSQWQKILLFAIILFPILGWLLRRATVSKWQKTSK